MTVGLFYGEKMERKIEEWIVKYPLLTQAVFPAVVVGTLGLAMFTISVALS